MDENQENVTTVKSQDIGQMSVKARNRSISKQRNQNKQTEKTKDNALIATLAAVTDTSARWVAWYLDSGATDHMSNNRSWFTNYKSQSVSSTYRCIFAQETSDINILAFNGEKWNEKHLSNVLYIPEIRYNLFSLSAVLDKGITQQFDQNTYLQTN